MSPDCVYCGLDAGEYDEHDECVEESCASVDLTAERPRLLDLYCGAGGAAMGYHRAGFEVTGVDHARQPDYPFPYHQADALTFPLDGYDAIHASPPCKRFTVANRVHNANTLRLFDPNDDLLTPTLERLHAHGGLWIVENVPGAPMPADAVTLCGSSFGLRVRRHRLFAASVHLEGTECRHDEQGQPVGVYGNGGAWTRTAPGGGGVKVAGQDAADALGIDWTAEQRYLSQAIPPAYTEYIGEQLMCMFPSVSRQGRPARDRVRGGTDGPAGGSGR